MTALWIRMKWGSESTLIICPKKAIPVWKDTIQKLGINLAEFTLVTFESFRIHYLEYLVPWDLVIIDESHRIKERGSQQTQRCWKVGKYAHKRLILSGSPQGQGLEDYYSQLRFIRPDLFPTWKSFCDDYIIMGDVWYRGMEEEPTKTVIGYKNEEIFKSKLREISYRVTRDEVSTVKTVVRTRKVWVEPSQKFTELYRNFSENLFLEFGESLVSAPHVLVKAIKLHQMCGGFIHDNDKEVHHLHSDKLEALFSLLDGELSGVPLVIVAQYKAELDYISGELNRRRIKHAQIRGRHQYDPNDRSFITLLHPSAGEAINLSHYSVMVIYSMSHSYLKWEQFKDRIVLVDTPIVKYYYLLAPGTVDEIVYESVVKKKKLSDAIMEVYNREGFRYNELSAEQKAEIIQQTRRNQVMKKTAAAPTENVSATSAIDAGASTPETTTPAAPTEPVITLAEICKELNIKPQSARVKLRRQLGEGRTKEVGFRWVFPLADKDKVIEMLKKTEAPAAEAAPAAEGTPTDAEGTDTDGETAPTDAGEPAADEPLPAE